MLSIGITDTMLCVKSHEEHVRRVFAAHGDRIVVVGAYTHSRIKIEYCCPEHGNYFAYAHNVERGSGCRRCAYAKRVIPDDEHRRRVYKIHGDRIVPLDPYIKAHIKLRYKCPDHGAFSATPANVIFRKSGCCRCQYEATSARCRKTHETYVGEAAVLGVEVLGIYGGAHEPILHRCTKGHKWEAKPNTILFGYGCPRCDQSQYKRRPIQVGERSVLVQGSEGKAVAILLEEGVQPADLAFTKKEGLPTFRYRFDGRWRVYIPDIYQHSIDQVIEVKSAITLGIYDETLYSQVRAKARAALRAGHTFRLMVIHRRQLIDLGRGWHRKPWNETTERFKRRARDRDRRYRRT